MKKPKEYIKTTELLCQLHDLSEKLDIASQLQDRPRMMGLSVAYAFAYSFLPISR